MENEKEITRLKSEYDERLKDMENDQASKIKQLVKEFNLELAEKEKSFQESFSEAAGLNRNIVLFE